MNKEEKLALENALKRIKELEKEANDLKNFNSKLSNDLINYKALYNSTDAKLNDVKNENKIINIRMSKLENENDKLKVEITKKDTIIEFVKKELVKEKIMKAKAVNTLFGLASAKTKNLVSEYINNSDKTNDNLNKEKKQPQKRGRKKDTESFGTWKLNNFESVERKVEIIKEKLKCSDCGEELKFSHYEEIIKIHTIKEHIRKEIIHIAVYECVGCGKKIRAEVKDLDCFKTSACTPKLAGYLSLLSCGVYLPANRISQLFSYNETPISRELITRYLIKTGNLLCDFVEFLRSEMQKQSVLMLDETVWYALDEEEQTNRIWAMTSGPKEQNRAVYFKYSSNRAKEQFDEILDENYSGVIVSDSYSVYFRQKLHQLCWSHLRKYLYDYLKALGSKAIKSKDYIEIKELLDKCNLVFDKDRELSKLDKEEILKRRKSELKPLIDDYFTTAEKYYNKDIDDPKNKAINYGLKNKENYYSLIENPEVPLTNNISETQMRKVVMKRVGSMFSASAKGASAMCVILSLVQSAKMNDLSPDKYITCLLENLNDLKDKRVAVSYLPWSKSLKDKLGFTKEEIQEATKEVEKEISKNKNLPENQ